MLQQKLSVFEKQQVQDNQEIIMIFKEDQEERAKMDLVEITKNPQEEEIKKYNEHDKARRERVDKLIAEGKLKTGRDYYHAAFIFQHGDTEEDYQKAFDCAKKSYDELHYHESRWILAATEDRLLLAQGKEQKYGTQCEQKKVGNTVTLFLRGKNPDRQAIDQALIQIGLPSLSEYEAKLKSACLKNDDHLEEERPKTPKL